MRKAQYWFRKVPGTRSRYVSIDWRGNVAVIVAVAVPLLATFGASAIRPWLALLIGPLALIGALWWLFAVVAKRVDPQSLPDS